MSLRDPQINGDVLDLIDEYADLLDNDFPEFVAVLADLAVPCDSSFDTFLTVMKDVLDVPNNIEALSDVAFKIVRDNNYFKWEGLDRFNKACAKYVGNNHTNQITGSSRTVEGRITGFIEELVGQTSNQDYFFGLPEFDFCPAYSETDAPYCTPIVAGCVSGFCLDEWMDVSTDFYVAMEVKPDTKMSQYAKAISQPHAVFLNCNWDNGPKLQGAARQKIVSNVPFVYVPWQLVDTDDCMVCEVMTVLPKDIIKKYNLPIWEG